MGFIRSGKLLYITVLSLSVLSFPFFGMFVVYRNPPYHRFGNLDIPWWTCGALLYLAEFGMFASFLRRHIGNKYVNLAVMIMVVVIIFALIGALRTALRQPSFTFGES